MVEQYIHAKSILLVDVLQAATNCRDESFLLNFLFQFLFWTLDLYIPVKFFSKLFIQPKVMLSLEMYMWMFSNFFPFQSKRRSCILEIFIYILILGLNKHFITYMYYTIETMDARSNNLQQFHPFQFLFSQKNIRNLNHFTLCFLSSCLNKALRR